MNEFYIHFENNKNSSGQRFYKNLYNRLKKECSKNIQKCDVVLFNISASIYDILKAKLLFKKIIIRVDGLWFDRLSMPFIETFKFPIKNILKFSLKNKIFENKLTYFANFVNENKGGFVKILLADHLVYQSKYARYIHQKYFPKKNNTVILNGENFKFDASSKYYDFTDTLNLCLIYSSAPAKGIYESLKFVELLNLKKKLKTRLFIIGFDDELPTGAPKDMVKLLKNKEIVTLIPKFNNFNKDIKNVIASCHCALFFSYRDTCPNALIELMSFHLPIIGLSSGGIPEIVKNAGILYDWDDWKDGYFCAHRYEFNYKNLDFTKMYNILIDLLTNYSFYKCNVCKRFENELSIDIIANKYVALLKSCKKSK